MAAVWREKGQIASEEKKTSVAEHQFLKAIDVLARQHEPNPDLIGLRHSLAQTYMVQGRPALAEPLVLRALEAGQQDSTSLHFATYLATAAKLYTMLKQPQKARGFYERALSLFEESPHSVSSSRPRCWDTPLCSRTATVPDPGSSGFMRTPWRENEPTRSPPFHDRVILGTPRSLRLRSLARLERERFDQAVQFALQGGLLLLHFGLAIAEHG